MQHLAILNQLIKALSTAGVDALTLKGPVLAFSLFGDIGMRHSSDLDLMINADDLHKSIEILAQ